MNFIVGVALSFVCMAIGLGGLSGVKAYWDLPSFVIVMGGTFVLILAMTNFSVFFSIPLVFLQMILPLPFKEADAVIAAQRMADKVRGAGIPSLTSEIPTAFDEFTKRGIKMLIAGTDSGSVRSVMETEINEIYGRHDQKIAALALGSAIGPAMGMIGTVLGLVQVLGNLEDTSKLGPSMALALITTLYGSLLANIMFIPWSETLKLKNNREKTIRSMIMEGLLAVQAGENSFLVGQKLKAFVNESMRAKIEGGKAGGKKKTEKYVELATYMNAIDQEKAMAFLEEVKKSQEKKDLGQDDAKNMLAELINEAEDKVIMKDFANEFMKSKTAKKLPAGIKRKGSSKKKGKKAAKAAAADDDDE